MAKLYKDKDGNKLYPVCSWEKNQHKLMNAYDIAWLRRYDEDWSEESCAECDRIQEAIDAFNAHVINGLVYATYQMGQIIKDYVWAYDARH